MRKAQSTIEYIVIIGSLAAALIIVGVYVKRGFQGNVRGLADQLGEQYSPGLMTIDNSDTTTLRSSDDSVSVSSDGASTTTSSDSSQTKTINRSASERIEALSEER